jgi:serine/threonine protein kinase
MDARAPVVCNACAHRFDVPAGSVAAKCPQCGAHITLTSMETRPLAALAKTDEPESLIGEVLGGYRLTAILGGGGMGVVYEAARTESATFTGPEIAAVKVLSSVFALDPEFVERFRREADALIQLRHPNLIEVYAKGEFTPPSRATPSYFFVMERFFGEDLRSFVARGPVAPRVAAAIVRGAAAGLAYAHQHGIVHRDVKPANILVRGDLEKDGAVKVVDFGVAQLAAGPYTLTSLTRSNLILGTINYMSPEQRVDASQIDHRADIYALGVVAYELLTGRLPIGAFEPPSELDGKLPRAVDRPVLSALRRDPGQRPMSVLAFAEELERTFLERRSAWTWVGAASGVALLLAAGSIGVYAPQWLASDREAKQELERASKATNPQPQRAEEPQPEQQLEPVEPKAEPKAEPWSPPPDLLKAVEVMRAATNAGVRASRATIAPSGTKTDLTPKKAFEESFQKSLELK